MLLGSTDSPPFTNHAGSCPDDCSNHGDCVGGVYCNCSGLWRGENCGQGILRYILPFGTNCQEFVH